MKTTIDTYPVFDANQVLTDEHLNTVVRYLDEQGRLTRASLVGIGISCGLDLTIEPDPARVVVTRGCAVTSQGYLLLEPEDLEFTAYRPYQLPQSDLYPAFLFGGAQIPLWEMFPDGEPDTASLSGPTDFLKDKAVLLFLERNQEELSDCSPNNCDDKGAEVTVTTRCLLVERSALERMQRELPDRTARLHLPDLRMHRFDVARTGPVTTRAILIAFQDMVRADNLVSAVHQALVDAYHAFEPLVQRVYAANPFDGFPTLYGFLQAFPATTRQVTFLPYYVDLFSDLLAAYDEFRARALEYTSICCPGEDWFPRHVVLGPDQRTDWYPASVSCCGLDASEDQVVSLFCRLVEITRRFGDDPPLREQSSDNRIDTQIRITPSRQGTAPLSARCIPYYYDFTGTPPLYQLWNPALTAQDRAHHNQAYRCIEYASAAPAFVKTPLSFDLDAFDFLRVEGHLGKDYRAVLSTLTAARDTFRLPFDLVVLRTGTPDDSVEVDSAEHACRFQDLEAAYAMLREELSCLAKTAVINLGRIKLKTNIEIDPEPNVNIRYSAASTVMGMPFAEAMKKLRVKKDTIVAAYVDNRIRYGDVPLTLTGESATVNTVFTAFDSLDRLTSLLAERLHEVNWAEFEKTVQRLQKLSEDIEREGSGDTAEGGLSWNELNNQIVAVVFACRLESLLTLRDEYVRRIEQIRKLAFFDGYAQEHPAIQHKAGVPMGGTLVLVYHGNPEGADEQHDAYGVAIAGLPKGAVVADFCLPYRCCSDCAPIQFVLDTSEPVVPPLTLSIERKGCTGDNGAEVELRGSGGRAPYTLRVGEQTYPAFPSALTVTLVPGTHSLQLTDAEQMTATPVTLQIPDPLAVGEVTYTDDTVAQTYTASFQVTGGSPPYTASQGTVVKDIVTLDGLATETTNVQISDNEACTTSASLSHTMPEPCTLPCAGEAARIRYPMWAPRPARVPYQYQEIREWRLRITDERGHHLYDQNLAERVAAILRDHWVEESNYNDIMQAVCGAMTTEVQRALPASFGANAFVAEFDPSAGTLRVEAYSCHTFEMRMQFTLVEPRPPTGGQPPKRDERWTYTRGGVKVEQRTTSGSASYSMPGFGLVAMNKCTNAVGQDCAVELRPIASKVSDNRIVLIPSFGEGVDPQQLTCHWHVDSPIVKYSQGLTLELPVTEETIQLQLLVLDRRGCWGFAQLPAAPNRRTPTRVPRRPR